MEHWSLKNQKQDNILLNINIDQVNQRKIIGFFSFFNILVPKNTVQKKKIRRKKNRFKPKS